MVPRVAGRLDCGVIPVGGGGPRNGVGVVDDAAAIDVSADDMVDAIVPKGSSAKFTERKRGSEKLAPLA